MSVCLNLGVSIGLRFGSELVDNVFPLFLPNRVPYCTQMPENAGYFL